MGIVDVNINSDWGIDDNINVKSDRRRVIGTGKGITIESNGGGKIRRIISSRQKKVRNSTIRITSVINGESVSNHNKKMI